MTFIVIREPDEVREVFRRHEDFLPTNALTAIVPIPPAGLRKLGAAGFTLPPILASATGEAHREVRSIVARFFTPATVASVEQNARSLTRVRCAAIVQSAAPVDIAESINQHVSPAIMSTLTGMRLPELNFLRRWSQDSLELFWGWPSPDRQEALIDSGIELYSWLRADIERSSSHSLFGALRAAGLDTAHMCSLGYFLIIAGQETTTQLINIVLHRALRDRSRWKAIAEGASGIPFVRQVLATESSVHAWKRFAPHDTVLGDRVIRAGTHMVLELSGNHPDAQLHADSMAYSLAFGYGVHRCLGAKLAELEASIVLEEVARTFPRLKPAGPDPSWTRLLSFQTPDRVMARNFRATRCHIPPSACPSAPAVDSIRSRVGARDVLAETTQ